MEKMVILPDVHQGYDIPIGSAVMLDNHIWPGAVGLDINCGMSHINTGATLTDLKLPTLSDREDFLLDLIDAVPTGYHCFETPKESFPKFPNNFGTKEVFDSVMEKADLQLGTLGGGNHFISLGVNKEDEVGITLHTGSRRAGHQVADYWMKRAKKDGINFNGLYMYPFDSNEGQAYYNDMLWAFQYANKNRELIMKSVLNLLGLKFKDYKKDMINETHNHAIDTGDGKILHRKGATPAEYDVMGVIPGNMRDGVFITRGLGNKDFLSSASHGAGRVMSRTKAKKSIKAEDLKREMSEFGIVINITNKNTDEGPDAYKDIFKVIGAQAGKVIELVDHFKPKIVHIG